MLEFCEDELLEFHNKISNNVKQYRKLKKFTQLDLAISLGFENSSFISHVENIKMKKYNYSNIHLYKISKVLDVDICEFFK